MGEVKKSKKETSVPNQDKQERIDLITQSLANPDVAKYYANGFASALGIGDVVITFTNNTAPTAVLNLSYTVAKTLSNKLNELIKTLEESSGNVIMTTDEINKALMDNKK